jgi:predicted RNA-binding Zn ribbon-like protein
LPLRLPAGRAAADRGPLRRWLARSELTPLAPVTHADLRGAHRLREVLRELAPAGRRNSAPTADAAFARLAHQAADWLTGPLRHDLRACPEQDCRGVFADPGGRRR